MVKQKKSASPRKPAAASLKVGLIQMQMAASAKENLAKATKMLRAAAKQGVQLACLPELFLSHYFCQSEDHDVFALAEPVPGPTTGALGKLARELKMVIIGSVFERRTAGVYHNTAVILDADGSLRGIYRKMHIPDDPLFYEKFYFTPGDLGFRAFDTQAGRIGTLVCWDQWFPEGARLTAMEGAQMLFYPTAIGWHPREKAQYGKAQADSWETIQRGHAIANGVFVAATNRIGHEGAKGGGIEFWGGSFICDPSGMMLARGSRDKEEIVVADIDLKDVETKRMHWPFFRDRRIDAYGGLTKRFGKN